MLRRFLIVASLVALLGATTTAAAGHHGRISESVIGAASIDAPYSVDVKTPADVLVARANVAPGASFGWHSHRAATVVVVKSGTLTLYDSADAACTPHRIKPGQGPPRSTTRQLHVLNAARTKWTRRTQRRLVRLLERIAVCASLPLLRLPLCMLKGRVPAAR